MQEVQQKCSLSCPFLWLKIPLFVFRLAFFVIIDSKRVYSERHNLIIKRIRGKEMASAAVMLLANAIPVSLNKPKLSSVRLCTGGGGGGGGSSMVVECSSRPQKKATSHHKKTRPKKTQPWDIKRKGPTVYPPLPVLPSDWTLVSSAEGAPPSQEVESDAPATVTT